MTSDGHVYRCWSGKPIAYDVIEFYVVRYRKRVVPYVGPDHAIHDIYSEYLHDGEWHVYEQGDCVRPALRIDGRTSTAFTEAEGYALDYLRRVTER